MKQVRVTVITFVLLMSMMLIAACTPADTDNTPGGPVDSNEGIMSTPGLEGDGSDMETMTGTMVPEMEGDMMSPTMEATGTMMPGDMMSPTMEVTGTMTMTETGTPEAGGTATP